MSMARLPLILWWCATLWAAFGAGVHATPRPAAGAPPAPVTVITIEGAIGPATAEHVRRGLTHAQRDGAQLVVLQMDTPGGLDTSMRRIIRDILASRVPVAFSMLTSVSVPPCPSSAMPAARSIVAALGEKK